MKRKNIRDPRYYLREFLDRGKFNPIAERLREGQLQQQVVPNAKQYDRTQNKHEIEKELKE